VKQLVRIFVGKNDELLGRAETIEYLDTLASRRSKGSAQVIDGFDGDAALDNRGA
jgi:hypothetical protein